MLMVLGGCLSVIGSRAVGFTSAGALGCMVLACVCGRSWQKPKHIADVMYNLIFICTRDLLIARVAILLAVAQSQLSYFIRIVSFVCVFACVLNL